MTRRTSHRTSHNYVLTYDRLQEDWLPIDDDELGERHEISNLGRVRMSVAGKRYPVGAILKPYIPEGRRSGCVTLYTADGVLHRRSLSHLVRDAHGAAYVAPASAYATSGLPGLTSLRDELAEGMEAVEEVLALAAALEFSPPAPPSEIDDNFMADRSCENVAKVEARILGRALQEFVDEDPLTQMDREEKLARVRRLRSTYGRMINEASQMSDTEMGVHGCQS